MRERFDPGRFVGPKYLLEILRSFIFKIPKKYHYIVLKEMEYYKLVKRINKEKYYLYDINCEKELRKKEEYVFW
jgi:hypothetical protein